MAYSRRSYKGAAVTNALASGTLNAGSTSITLASAMTGWSTGSTPFFIVIDPGTAKEEKVCVVYNTATTLTVVDPAVTSGWSASAAGRGCDDTQDRQHDGGATVYPVFTAIEANQANELVSKYTTNGDIVVHGSTGLKTIPTGGSANNGKVLVADSTVTDGGVRWGDVGSAFIADNSITSAKIVDGAIVNADINASAAIALSKLATGALPTAITVASANIVDGTIVAGDIADGAITSAKILDGTIAVADLATAVINKLIPSGTISPYVGSSSPTGWLICDGTTVVGGQSTYPDLWAVLPAIYKSGSNIVLPNLKGRTVVGLDSAQTEFDAIGETGGAKTHTLTEAEIPSHSHSYTGPTGAATYNTSGADLLSTMSSTTTGTTGGGGAHNNLQPYITFNYIIKT